jgi:hypothetical protein
MWVSQSKCSVSGCKSECDRKLPEIAVSVIDYPLKQSNSMDDHECRLMGFRAKCSNRPVPTCGYKRGRKGFSS